MKLKTPGKARGQGSGSDNAVLGDVARRKMCA